MTTFDCSTSEELQCILDKIINNVVCHSCTKNKTKQIYLAGPWFTITSNMLENAAAAIYNNVSGNSQYVLFRPKLESKNSPEETYCGNIDAINNSDIIVALISEKDVGTAFEIGYARAKGKFVVLVGLDESDFERKTNLMLAYASTCCTTINNLWKIYTDDLDITKDCVIVNHTWRNIE